VTRADRTSEIDELFQLPLDAFTAARNALAARLKKAGRLEEAERVRTLGKPPVSAWAVNQVYWRHRQPFDRLIASGERFRKAQAAQLAGNAADLKASLDDRREALLELSKLAAGVLRESGHTPSSELMRRVNTTLEALATYGAHPDAAERGRLTDDLAPPGFEALAALVPRDARTAKAARGPHGARLRRGVRKERSRVLPFTSRTAAAKGKGKGRGKDAARQREAERARATAALRDAERALKQARKAAEQAETALKQAAARAKTAEQAKRELEARLEKTSAAADQARQQARGVAAQAEDAAQAVADAERSVDAARRQLDELDRQ
jgi:hypothetical protein